MLVWNTYMSEVKYLGVQLCKDFSDDMSMFSCIKGLYRRYVVTIWREILNFIHRRWESNYFRVFARFYIVHYCVIFTKSSYDKIMICYNNVFRCVCQMSVRGNISQQFLVHNVRNFDVTRCRFNLSCSRGFSYSENVLILTLSGSVYFMYSIMFEEWMSIWFERCANDI